MVNIQVEGGVSTRRVDARRNYDRIVDVMEELVRFTVLLRPHAEQLVDRYSERVDGDRPVVVASDILASIDRALVTQACKS